MSLLGRAVRPAVIFAKKYLLIFQFSSNILMVLRRPKSQRGSLNLNFMGYRTFGLLKVSVLMGIYHYGGCREIRLARINGLLIMKFVVNDSTAFAVFFCLG